MGASELDLTLNRKEAVSLKEAIMGHRRLQPSVMGVPRTPEPAALGQCSLVLSLHVTALWSNMQGSAEGLRGSWYWHQ